MDSERYDIDAQAEATKQAQGEDAPADSASQEWLRRSHQLYQQSTDYYQSSLFRSWRDNINHFRSQHAPDSKYMSDAYRNRSHVFRPKPRSAVRTLEATAAAALFTNDDLLQVRGVNPDDPLQADAGKLHQAILQHRLETTIPWFLTVIGAYQDTHVYGVCISRQYWDRRTKQQTQYVPVMNEDGTPLTDDDGYMLAEEVKVDKILADEPAIKMIPPDQFRFDPAADWRDPVKTSPYLIEVIPMYAIDVMAMMESGEWHEYSLGQLISHGSDDDGAEEVVRDAREGKGREDAYEVNPGNEYSVVWVHNNIIRDSEGEDWTFYTVGTGLMLTDPVPLDEVEPLGREQYTVGVSSIEAHRSHPAGTIELNRPLTEMANDIANLRLDNVKLVLNKRYAIRRDSKIDLGALMRNVAGGGVMMNDVERDLKIMETPDVTSSSYAEQDRLSVESDELLGTFSQSSVNTNRNLNETVGGMNLMASGANQVQELGLRTFIETWVEKVLRSLVKLEGLYETDETVLALAAGKAEVEGEISDDLLMQDLVVKINVGMGNTNPEQKMARFLAPLQAAGQLPDFMSDVNTEEVGKELFALAGQGDGARFMLTNEQKEERSQGNQTPPEIQLKMQELKLREQELQFKMQQAQQEVQMAAQQQQWEQEYKAAELQTQQEREMAELALKEGITMAQLEQQLRLESAKMEAKMAETSAQLQTTRDAKAAELSDKQLERQAKRDNQAMGFDSY